MLDLVKIREPRGFEDRVEAAVAPNSPSEFLSNLLAEHEDYVAQMLDPLAGVPSRVSRIQKTLNCSAKGASSKL